MKTKLFFGFFLSLLLLAGCEKEDQDLATKLSGTIWKGEQTTEVMGAVIKETVPAKRIFYFEDNNFKVRVWDSGPVIGQITSFTNNTFSYNYLVRKKPICNGVTTLLVCYFEGRGEIHGDSLIENGTVKWTTVTPFGLNGDSITSEKNGEWSAKFKLK